MVCNRTSARMPPVLSSLTADGWLALHPATLADLSGLFAG
jgi:hypothetical protein